MAHFYFGRFATNRLRVVFAQILKRLPQRNPAEMAGLLNEFLQIGPPLGSRARNPANSNG